MTKTANETKKTALVPLKDSRREILNQAETISCHMWRLLTKLTETAYDHLSDQLNDAIQVGALAQSIKDIRAAAERLNS